MFFIFLLSFIPVSFFLRCHVLFVFLSSVVPFIFPFVAVFWFFFPKLLFHLNLFHGRRMFHNKKKTPQSLLHPFRIGSPWGPPIQTKEYMAAILFCKTTQVN